MNNDLLTNPKLPPQITLNKWNMNINAIENTMDYIFNVIRHPCYLVGIKSKKVYFFKLIPKNNQHQTPPVVYNIIKNNIKNINKNPYLNDIDKRYIKSNVDLNNIRLMQCILKDYKETGLDLSENEYFLLINKIKEQLNNGVFILNLNDSIILKSKSDPNNPYPYDFGKINEPVPRPFRTINNLYHPFLPILGAGKKGYNDIPIPNYDEVMRALDTQISITNFYNIYGLNDPDYWDKKINKAVFRGSPSGCGTYNNTNMRIKLSKLSKTTELSKYVDSCLVGRGERSIKMDPIYGLSKNYNKDILSAACPNNKGLTMIQQSKFKYIIHIDGNVNAYRLLNTMLTGSLILRVKSNYIHWADHILKEGIHYISIDGDLSNIESRIKWCIKHDIDCKRIAKNGMKIAEKLISSSFIYNTFITYFNYLSKKYNNNFNSSSYILDKNKSLTVSPTIFENNKTQLKEKSNQSNLYSIKKISPILNNTAAASIEDILSSNTKKYNTIKKTSNRKLMDKKSTYRSTIKIIPSNKSTKNQLLIVEKMRCPNGYNGITRTKEKNAKICKKKNASGGSSSQGNNENTHQFKRLAVKTLKLPNQILNRNYANQFIPKKYIDELYNKYNSSSKLTVEDMNILNFTRINDKWLGILIASFFIQS